MHDLIISLVSILGEFVPISIPLSLMASTTTGFTLEEGTVPALEAFRPRFLANASAIWLLPAFSTHTNRIVPLASLAMSNSSFS